MVGASEDVRKRKKDVSGVGSILDDAWEWNEDISELVCALDDVW